MDFLKKNIKIEGPLDKTSGRVSATPSLVFQVETHSRMSFSAMVKICNGI